MSDNVDYEIKVYTQEDFDNFPIMTDGMKHCSSGDYSMIKKFPDMCYFEDHCIFGTDSIFGSNCCFLPGSIFGNYCKFGYNCEFTESCTFGCYCYFLNGCRFGAGCIFGYENSFEDDCKFGIWCDFGGWCVFQNNCIFEVTHKAKKGYPLLSFSGFGEENIIYFFNCVDGIFVRCGCFSGFIDQFREHVKETSGYIDPFSEHVEEAKEGELIEEYLTIADFVERKWSVK